ncbi:MAG TPA: prenyltransferase, partial [Actinomycetota bacterium]|nr:prenyltransferase [Actinomycetota bacterium]
MSSLAFDAHQSAQSILAVQTEYGAIPWWPGGQLDVWNHVESAMALDACGFAREAEAAYRWLAAIQRTDGAWCAAYVDGRPTDATLDA